MGWYNIFGIFLKMYFFNIYGGDYVVRNFSINSEIGRRDVVIFIYLFFCNKFNKVFFWEGGVRVKEKRKRK